VPRFPYALLGALALHGLVLLVRARHSLDATAPTANEEPATQTVELEEFPVADAPVAPPERVASLAERAQPATPSAIANHAAASLSKGVAAEAAIDAEPATVADALAPPATAGSAETGDAAPARKIDLGLDGHFFLNQPAAPSPPGPAPAAELGPRARKSTVQRELQAALSADDVQRGLARGNALLGSLSSAARAEGPLRGEATFRATVSADGSFGAVELLHGTAAEWSAVLSAFRKLAASKRVRVPPGAKGLRVTFSVRAKVQLPSGKDARDTAVRVADPSLGPNGLVPSGDFDLADLGGSPQRLVYARVVSEEVL